MLNKYNINPDEEHFNRFFTEYLLWIDGLFFLASSESPYLFKLRKKVSKGDSTKLFLLETLTTFISKYKEKNDSRMKEWDDNNVPVKSDHYKWLLCFEAGLMKCTVKEELFIQRYSFFSKEDLLKMAEDNERKSESSHFNPW